LEGIFSSSGAKSFIFHGDKLYKQAVILMFLHGENLNVELYQAFDWKPISKKKRITKTKVSLLISILIFLSAMIHLPHIFLGAETPVKTNHF